MAGETETVGTSPPRPRGGGERGRGLRGGAARGRGAASSDGAAQNGDRQGQGQKKRRGGGRGAGAGPGAGPGNRGSMADRPTSNGNTMNTDDLSARFSSSGETGGEEPAATPKVAAPVEGGAAAEEKETCWICASEIEHESVAPCNHRTCHICALRMRGLYKEINCATCRTPAEFVIFTDDASKKYEDFTEDDIKAVDLQIGIKYEKLDIQEDTKLLLQFNCPVQDCDVACRGWEGAFGLRKHVNDVHGKKMCDLCTSNKKVFTHEHELFDNEKEVQKHKLKGDDRPGAVDQSGFRGHPRCGFCTHRYFYGDDELFVHCREKHERCFICDRVSGGRPLYFEDGDGLQQHFESEHFTCKEPECVRKKYIAFPTEIDLKAHQLAEHSNSLSKDVRRDVQTVSLSDFNYREPFSMQRGGGSNRGRGRGRDPNAEPIPSSSAQPLRRDEVAFQRQMAIHSAQSVSNRTFGGQLTAPAPAPRSSQPSVSAPRPPANVAAATAAINSLDLAQPNESLTPQEHARQLRHRAVVERASNFLGNDEAKMAQFRTGISSYKNNNMTAQALINQFFTLFSGTPSNALGTLIREIADLYEDSKKGDALRTALNNWRAINEDYPSLPVAGPSTSSSIPLNWARAAPHVPPSSSNNNNTSTSTSKSTRVLKLKSSTAQSSRSGLSINRSWGGAAGPSSVSSSSNTRDRERDRERERERERDPTPGELFPGLPLPPSRSTASRPATVQTASWVSVNGSGSRQSSSAPTSRPASRLQTGDAFPALPKAQKPQSTIMSYGNGRMVRRDVGGGGPVGGSAWGGGGVNAGGSGETSGIEGDGEGGNGKGKKKGNKGKKQVLMNWG